MPLRFTFVWTLAAVLGVISSSPLGGQSSLGEVRRQATRSELELAAKAAESAAAAAKDAKTHDRILQDASAIRQRLQNGDFIPGDRIYVQVVGDSALTDTFTVHGERLLKLPNLPDITLRGVLDSELAGYLRTEIAKFVKDPTVSATPLLRVAVMGAIGHPGFMTVPTDQALSDLIMGAGGPTGVSDLDKTIVRRSGKTVIEHAVLQEAIRRNRTVGDISLRDGDEVYVPTMGPGFTYLNAISVLSTAMGLYFLIRWGTRRGGIR
jgi:protein involved in polysaccharide export with SLBB domain